LYINFTVVKLVAGTSQEVYWSCYYGDWSAV